MNIPLVGVPSNEGAFLHGYNAGTGAISAGNPVFLQAAILASSLATPVTTGPNKNDGVYVLSASEGYATSAQPFHLGVCQSTVQPGEYVSMKCFGFVQRIVLLIQTRAASTSVWASYPAVTQGQPIVPSSLGYTTAGATQSAAYEGILALEAYPSSASTVSTTADTRTSITTAVRAFVRMM